MNGDIGIDSPPVLVATDDQQLLPANRICFIFVVEQRYWVRGE